MELQDYLRVMRKRWRIITAVTLLALAAAATAVLLVPKSYQATARLFVSTNMASTTTELAAGSTFSQAQVKSYADILTTPKVLDPVVKQLQLPVTATDLAQTVKASVPPDTSIISVSATDQDPARAAQVANAIANQAMTTVTELETVAGGRVPVKVTVVESAQGTGEQVQPRPVRDMGLALALGLLLGLGLALLRERLDTSVRSAADVREVTDHTIIGEIHFDTSATHTPLLVQGDSKSARAEAFRSLRTNLQFINVSEKPKSIVITSSVPNEGKTTTAANLATTLAAANSTVCIVEGDLRRPRLLDYMGLESGVGLTNVLIGDVELSDVVQPFGPTGVTVLGAGPVPPNPSELLGSKAMKHLLDTLTAKFDYVLVDAPPLLPVTDAAVVSALVDGAIVVAGANVVHRESLSRALGLLDTVEARVLGIVVNRVPTKGGKSYYHYDPYTYGTSEDKGTAAQGASAPTTAPATAPTTAPASAQTTTSPAPVPVASSAAAGGSRSAGGNRAQPAVIPRPRRDRRSLVIRIWSRLHRLRSSRRRTPAALPQASDPVRAAEAR